MAAQKQGRFWEYHDRLFANQRNMKREALLEHARELGLDMDRFESDLANLANKTPVDSDTREARSMGLTGTPAFFVNGRYLRGAQPFEAFAKLIDAELQKRNRPLPASRRGP